MTKTIRREFLIPQPREQVWRATPTASPSPSGCIPTTLSRASATTLRSAFRVPPNPDVGFDGLVVSC